MTRSDPSPGSVRGPRRGEPLPPGPVLAVCGWSGSGKTSVLEQVIPPLVRRGLAVAALKHDAHGLQIDPRGRDSDRLFRAGADVLLRGPAQSLLRRHHPSEPRPPGALREGDLAAALAVLLASYDLVLVEGHKGTPLPKVWTLAEGEAAPPPGVRDIVDVLPRGGGRAAALLHRIEAWLPEAWRKAPVLAGVLIGGRSRRMGSPKQLLEREGRTLLERTIEALAGHAEQVVLLGEGAVPEACTRLPRLPDPPRLAGPLAGILGALRWAPEATWVLAGCDHPWITERAVAWLLEQRAPARWAILPRLGGAGVEPLLALYDGRVRGVLESLASGGCLAPSALSRHPRAFTPHPPAEIASAWRDADTRAALRRLPEPSDR